jgi:hypothetical protein
MIRVNGAVEPKFSARLDVAATVDGKPVPAKIEVSEGAAT